MKKPTSADPSWAKNLDWMEGVPEWKTIKSSTPISRTPGILFVMVMAVAAILLGHAIKHYSGPTAGRMLDPVMVAMLLGLVLGNLGLVPLRCKSGVGWAVRRLLPVGIVLLGVRLNFGDVMRVGGTGLWLSALFVVLAVAFFGLLIRWSFLPLREGLLLGIGTAICGGTAIVALAPIIKAREPEIVLSVATVTLVGLIAMVICPIVAQGLGLDSAAFGVWVGLAVHQTPQVVAAGFAHSPAAGEIATVVKLSRVCLLAPVIMVIGVIWARKERHAGLELRPWWRTFPLFMFGFIMMAVLNAFEVFPNGSLSWESAGGYPVQVAFSMRDLLTLLSGFLLATAMAGVGLESRVSVLRQSSSRAICVAGLAAILLAALALVAAVAFAR